MYYNSDNTFSRLFIVLHVLLARSILMGFSGRQEDFRYLCQRYTVARTS